MTPNETVQEWRLNNASASTLLPVAIPLLLLAFGLATLIASAFGKVQVNDFKFGFLVVWTCVGLWLTYNALSMPRRIAMGPGGWLSFRGPLGEKRVRAQDVVSIRPKPGRLGYLQRTNGVRAPYSLYWLLAVRSGKGCSKQRRVGRRSRC